MFKTKTCTDNAILISFNYIITFVYFVCLMENVDEMLF